MRQFRFFLLLSLAVALVACKAPQHYESAKELKREAGQSRLLMMPPDIELSELTAGGLLEPHADWTDAATQYLDAALRQQLAARNIEMTDYDEERVPTERRASMHELYKLYGTVGEMIFVHQYAGKLQLTTKSNGFDWSLGPAMSGLREQYGTDYALLTFVRDSYSSTGREAVIVLGAMAAISVPGGVQVAFISLVDLRTGDIVWFSRIVRNRGDLRNAAGAQAIARALLAGFPK